MTRPLTQIDRDRWASLEDDGYLVTRVIPSRMKFPGKPYGIRAFGGDEQVFVYVASLDQVPEAIEEYKNRKAVAVLTGQPMKHMWDWQPRTPRRKKADTGELFGQPARRARA